LSSIQCEKRASAESKADKLNLNSFQPYSALGHQSWQQMTPAENQVTDEKKRK
jgi:hypothetical protein